MVGQRLDDRKVIEIRWRRYDGESLDDLALAYGTLRERIISIIRGHSYADVPAGPILDAHYRTSGGILLERPVSPVFVDNLQWNWININWTPGDRPTTPGWIPPRRRRRVSIMGGDRRNALDFIRMLRWQYWAGELEPDDVPFGADAYIFGYPKEPFGPNELWNLSGVPGQFIGGPVMGRHYEHPGDPLDFTAFNEGSSYTDYIKRPVYWDIGDVPLRYQDRTKRPRYLLDNIYGGKESSTIYER